MPPTPSKATGSILEYRTASSRDLAAASVSVPKKSGAQKSKSIVPDVQNEARLTPPVKRKSPDQGTNGKSKRVIPADDADEDTDAEADGDDDMGVEQEEEEGEAAETEPAPPLPCGQIAQRSKGPADCPCGTDTN